jgi:Tfp pilus assembly protein PilF
LYENKYDRSRPKDELLPLIDTMEYHVRQALKIHPKYGNAWVMRGIVASARFDVDHQMDRLFNEFDGIIDAVPYNATFRNNMDAYIKYLATSGGNPHKIISFALRNGYDRFYKEKGDLNNAITFLNYGLMTQTEDVRILNALSEVYQAAGDAAKSNEMKRRAEAMEE